MFEVYRWLYDAAKAYWLAGGFLNYLIGCILFVLAIVYLIYLVNIPFYLAEIAKNTRRNRK